MELWPVFIPLPSKKKIPKHGFCIQQKVPKHEFIFVLKLCKHQKILQNWYVFKENP